MKFEELDAEKVKKDFLCIVNRIKSGMLKDEDLEIKISKKPHKPCKLPEGKMAVYAFFYKGICLKVGKAGPKSNARFCSHHYGKNRSKSNLANSILNDNDRDSIGIKLGKERIGKWIQNNLDRVDFLLCANKPIATLNLLEVYFQLHFEPRYEGFESQR